MCESTKSFECACCSKIFITTVREDLSPQMKYYYSKKDEVLSKQKAHYEANKQKKKNYYQIKKAQKALELIMN